MSEIIMVGLDGIRRSLFAAGHGKLTGDKRTMAIHACDGVVAWGKDGGLTNGAWADIAVSVQLKKRLYIGSEGIDFPAILHANRQRINASIFPGVTSEELWELSGWFSVHSNSAGKESPLYDGTRWLKAICKCESPVERRLCVHLLDVAEQFPFEVHSQYPVEDDKHSYRLDFAIIEPEYGVRLAIEADGHEFHERTKEQAKNDRSRDRDLILLGWTVIRFTGSEIWNNPLECAEQISEIVSSKYMELGTDERS